MRSVVILVLVPFCWLALGLSASGGTFSFVPGHYYATSNTMPFIHQYDAVGNHVAYLVTNSGSELSRLVFGPDQNLYLLSRSYDINWNLSAQVQAFNKYGKLIQRYVIPSSSLGDFALESRIVFDGVGHFYFGNLKFDMGDTDSGQVHFTNGTFPYAVLPNGNFLTNDGSAVRELDPAGRLVREIYRVPYAGWDTISGMAYDVATDALVVSGVLDRDYKIWKVDFDSGDVLTSTNFGWSADVFVTPDGSILAGSFSNAPALFTSDLEPILRLGDTSRRFVTQFIPEPPARTSAGIGLMAVLAIVVLRARRSWSKRRLCNQLFHHAPVHVG